MKSEQQIRDKLQELTKMGEDFVKYEAPLMAMGIGQKVQILQWVLGEEE